MPIEIYWAVDKRVVFIQMTGEISSEDIEHWDTQAIALLDEAYDSAVYVLVDETDVTMLKGFARLVTMKALRHPKIREIGLYVVYGVRNKILEQANMFMAMISGIPTRIVADRDEAVALLHSHDPTLPDLNIREQPASE